MPAPQAPLEKSSDAVAFFFKKAKEILDQEFGPDYAKRNPAHLIALTEIHIQYIKIQTGSYEL